MDTAKEEALEEEEEQEIQFNQESVNYLLQCGIPELGAKWELYLSNNDTELALGLYCENAENPDYKKPLLKIKVKKNKNEDDELAGINMASLESLISMGFDRKKAIAGLKKANGNVDAALNLMFSEPNLGEENQNEEKKMDLEEDKKNLNEGNGSLYNMYGFITHLGKNTDHGHYVCHIRQEGNKWTYFNDSKVTLWEEPPIKKGYIYFYRNLSNDNK